MDRRRGETRADGQGGRRKKDRHVVDVRSVQMREWERVRARERCREVEMQREREKAEVERARERELELGREREREKRRARMCDVLSSRRARCDGMRREQQERFRNAAPVGLYDSAVRGDGEPGWDDGQDWEDGRETERESLRLTWMHGVGREEDEKDMDQVEREEVQGLYEEAAAVSDGLVTEAIAMVMPHGGALGESADAADGQRTSACVGSLGRRLVPSAAAPPLCRTRFGLAQRAKVTEKFSVRRKRPRAMPITL